MAKQSQQKFYKSSAYKKTEMQKFGELRSSEDERVKSLHLHNAGMFLPLKYKEGHWNATKQTRQEVFT